MPKDVQHYTLQSFHAPDTPSYLLSKSCSKALLGHKKDYYDFINKSILVWGSWGWWRTNSARQEEWDTGINGITEMSDQIAAKSNLIDYWLSCDQKSGSEQSKLKRAHGAAMMINPMSQESEGNSRTRQRRKGRKSRRND
eukprot:4803239-Ditylum_brightwellii.AAC.1